MQVRLQSKVSTVRLKEQRRRLEGVRASQLISRQYADRIGSVGPKRVLTQDKRKRKMNTEVRALAITRTNKRTR